MSCAKRRADDESAGSERKKTKGNKQWHAPRSGAAGGEIQPGVAGIWATCDRGKEGRCVNELRDLFEQYAGDAGTGVEIDRESGQVGGVDIAADIQKELDEMRDAKPESSLFTPVRMDTPCLVFFETREPIEPVSLVRTICQDASRSAAPTRSRFVKRLTPITLTGKATESGLEQVARKVLAPHFHEADGPSRTFAIRHNCRNNNVLKRDTVINQVAAAVGQKHKVDLKKYDLLIIVEIYKNICGMSVVSNDFEELKRYNLAELFNPMPKADAVDEAQTQAAQ